MRAKRDGCVRSWRATRRRRSPIAWLPMVTASELDAEWRAALQHAGFALGRARLYVFDTPPAERGHNAVWLEPGDVLVVDESKTGLMGCRVARVA